MDDFVYSYCSTKLSMRIMVEKFRKVGVCTWSHHTKKKQQSKTIGLKQLKSTTTYNDSEVILRPRNEFRDKSENYFQNFYKSKVCFWLQQAGLWV